MSGAEIFGIVIGVVGLIDIIKRFVDAVRDAKDLPKEFFQELDCVERELGRFTSLLNDPEKSAQMPREIIENTIPMLKQELCAIVDGCRARYQRKWFFKRIRRYRSGQEVHRDMREFHRKVTHVHMRMMIELQLHSTNKNGEFREAIKEDGVSTRRTMEEFHKEMREKVQAILTNLQLGPNVDALSQQGRTDAGIGSTFHPNQPVHNSMVTPSAEWEFFRARFKALIATLNRGYLLENIPTGSERPQNPTRRDDESKINVDDTLESCLRLLNDLRHKRTIDPVNAFFTLRNLSRQLVALHHYLDAVEVHQHIVVLLRHLQSTSAAFRSDFTISLASLAVLLAVTGEFKKAKSVCHEAIRHSKSSSTSDVAVPHNAVAIALRVALALENSTEELEELLPLAEEVYATFPDEHSRSQPLHLLNRADILSVRGRMLMQKGDIRGAIVALDEAVELYESMGESHPAHLKLALVRLAEAQKANGQQREAALHLSHADRVVQEMESLDIVSPIPRRWAGGFRAYQPLQGTPLMNYAARGTGHTSAGLLGRLFESPAVRPGPAEHLAKQSPATNVHASFDSLQLPTFRTERSPRMGQWLGRTWLRTPRLSRQDALTPAAPKVYLHPLPPPPEEPEHTRVSIEKSSSSISLSVHSHVTTASEARRRRRYAVYYQPFRRNVDSG